jgi:hypothetical protein
MASIKWCELIAGVYDARPPEPGIVSKPVFYAAALTQNIAIAEARLDAKLPVCLKSLLLETDGVMDMLSIDGGEWFKNMWLLWPLDEIVNRNLVLRAETATGNYERGFQKLLFFADAGADGILFAFPVAASRECASNVVAWYPVEDELTGMSPSLEGFLRGWLVGDIAV